jgi:hypothetical protein
MPAKAESYVGLTNKILEEIPIEDFPIFPSELHKVYDIIYLKVDTSSIKENKDFIKEIIEYGLWKVSEQLKKYHGIYNVNLIKIRGENCFLFYILVPKECKIDKKVK